MNVGFWTMVVEIQLIAARADLTNLVILAFANAIILIAMAFVVIMVKIAMLILAVHPKLVLNKITNAAVNPMSAAARLIAALVGLTNLVILEYASVTMWNAIALVVTVVKPAILLIAVLLRPARSKTTNAATSQMLAAAISTAVIAAVMKSVKKANVVVNLKNAIMIAVMTAKFVMAVTIVVYPIALAKNAVMMDAEEVAEVAEPAVYVSAVFVSVTM